MKFEWDQEKSLRNLKKHGISFKDAIEIFLGIRIRIELESDDEARWAAIGKAEKRFYTAIYTLRKNKIRLISVRRSRKDEENYYGQIFRN